MAETTEARQPQQGADQARDKAQEVAGQARDKAQEAVDQAGSRVRDQVQQRSTEAGERVRSSAQDLRSVSQELRNQGKDAPARLADQAATRVEKVGNYLADSDADRILHDVEDFGRRQPMAVLAGGVLLGMFAARFLKASSSRRYRSGTAPTNGAIPSRPYGSVPQLTSDVRPAAPDGGEHHQRFEGHS